MKKLFILTITILLVNCFGTLSNNSVTEQEIQLIENHLKDFPNGFQISIALIKNGKTHFLGLTVENDSLIRVNNMDSLFEVGSITKIFTSTILANLIITNKVALNEPIIHTLPFNINPHETNAPQITFKTLANHTSGLPNYPSNFDSVAERNPLNPFCEYDSLLLKSYLENELSLQSNPGKTYQYSNLGYGLLGYLLELKTGKSFEQLLTDFVFKKYRLTSSTINRDEIKTGLVNGINEKGETLPNWDFNIHEGAGAVLSTTRDLSKFVMANFKNDSVLFLQRQKTFDDHNTNMALGWEMNRFGGYHPYYWYIHNGGTLGYTSSICMDTKAKSAVIVLSNFTSFNPKSNNIKRLSRELLKYQYLSGSIDHSSYCEAPYLEIALTKGWGTGINKTISNIKREKYPLVGVWQKQMGDRKITRTFTPEFKTQIDFYGDDEIDVWGYYKVKGDTIYYNDIGGNACDFTGIYRYKIQDDSLHFTLLKDNECDGRVQAIEGVWIRKR